MLYFQHFYFAVSSTSGFTLAPGASAAGPVDNATPKEDYSNANAMEVEEVVRGLPQSATSGGSSATGDIPLKDVSADASELAALGNGVKNTQPKVVWTYKRSISAGISASVENIDQSKMLCSTLTPEAKNMMEAKVC